MEKTKEELNKHFWHRLYKVILWPGSIFVSLFIAVLIPSHNFWQFSKTFIIFSYFAFLIFFITYRLILYIALGGKLFFEKKDRTFFIKILLIFIIILGTVIFTKWQKDKKEQEIKNIEIRKMEEQNRIKDASEKKYEGCISKLKSYSTYDKAHYGDNIYFDEWQNAGSPDYNQRKGHWEWAVVGFVIKNHPEVCEEFNLDSIKTYLQIRGKEIGINYLD